MGFLIFYFLYSTHLVNHLSLEFKITPSAKQNTSEVPGTGNHLLFPEHVMLLMKAVLHARLINSPGDWLMLNHQRKQRVIKLLGGKSP